MNARLTSSGRSGFSSVARSQSFIGMSSGSGSGRPAVQAVTCRLDVRPGVPLRGELADAGICRTDAVVPPWLAFDRLTPARRAGLVRLVLRPSGGVQPSVRPVGCIRAIDQMDLGAS